MEWKKRILPAALAAAVAAGAAGCSGADQSWSAKKDGETLPIGVYVYSLYSAIQSAQYEEGVDSAAPLLEQQVEGRPAEEWISDRALWNVKEIFYLRDRLAEMGISLTDADKEEAGGIAAAVWGAVPESVKKYVAQESFNIAYGETSKMMTKLFEALYGEGGEQEVSEDELRAEFEGSYYDFDYLFSSLAYKTQEEAAGGDTKMTEEESAARKAEFEEYARQIEEGELTLEEAAARFQQEISAAEEQLNHRTLHGSSVEASYPEEIKQNLDEMKEGEVRCFEVSNISDGIVILRKNAIAGAADEFLQDEANRTLLLTSLKSEEFEDMLQREVDAYAGVTFNDAAISRYKPSQFYTFTPPASGAAG